MTQRKTVLCIFGTRPEAIKMVPVIRALQSSNWARCIVVVTAQHRDLLDQMLTRFGIAVDYDLNIMQPKQSLNSVLARMLPELEGIIQTEQPYAVLAQGDTATVFGGRWRPFMPKCLLATLRQACAPMICSTHSLKRVTAKWSRASPSGTLHPLRVRPMPCDEKA